MTARVIERSKTSTRVDDDPEVLKKRFITYIEQTKPVIDYYEKLGKVVVADAEKSIPEVYEAIKPSF